MSLAALIRKRESGGFATATVATPCPTVASAFGQKPVPPRAPTVATVATVAVANTRKQKTAPLAAEEETVIRAWLASIGEADPATIAEVIGRCRIDAGARDYLIGRAAAELPKPDPFPDDLRACGQCANLMARQCLAAKRGEIAASRNHDPVRDIPRRCEGYAPGADDPDRRQGRERWPGLTEAKGTK